MTQDQLAEDADVSTNTIRHIEQGGRSRLLTLPKIETALRWEQGSAALILEGREPIEVGSVQVPAPTMVATAGDGIDRPPNLSEEDWHELRALLNSIIASWIAARQR